MNEIFNKNAFLGIDFFSKKIFLMVEGMFANIISRGE